MSLYVCKLLVYLSKTYIEVRVTSPLQHDNSGPITNHQSCHLRAYALPYTEVPGITFITSGCTDWQGNTGKVVVESSTVRTGVPEPNSVASLEDPATVRRISPIATGVL